jgi:uncharacterized protein (DUF1778 family)
MSDLELPGNLPYNPRMTNQSNTTARLEARLPVDVHALLRRAAEIEGRTLTDFVVAAASAAARKTIEDAEVIKLSVEDQQRFAEALINPQPLAPALQRAMQRHRRLFGAPGEPTTNV